ncbi:MAG TPA: UDP-N-acetylmuramoyl-tripeptide--D-alanyl-D-alanine ligase [Longimicrobiales bacterium]|nr:UDP-N-acetylmuramoyl-tripeptide--D-alanyl-D-alanine ligase [Longimicrobiales bacterium]
MTTWTDAMIISALGVERRASSVEFTGISTDSRSIQPGSLFVALKGENFDAHDYLVDIAEKGARGAVVSRVPPNTPDNLILYRVEDTTVALGMLGRHRRRTVAAKLCAVAGSNGKTTTKEILKAMLSAKYRVHATSGNFNNLVGVPLTLLATPDDAEIIVAELGTNAPGEIARLADIVEADAAVVTAISEEHLEGLGDLRGVLEEETALLPSLKEDGLAVVADEPPALAVRSKERFANVQVAGWSDRADVRAEHVDLDENGNVTFRWQGRDVRLPLRGRHNARNALIALAIALHFGVDADAAIAQLSTLKPAKMRGEVHEYGDIKVIVDCYNSNPASLSAAIDLLASMPHHGDRVAIVGSMLELGPSSAELHRKGAEEIAQHDFDVVVATGQFADAFENIAVKGKLIRAAEPLDAFEQLAPDLQGNELILLKGSRGVSLERLLPRIETTMGMSHPHGEAGRPGARSPRTDKREDAQSAGHSQSFTAPNDGEGNH